MRQSIATALATLSLALATSASAQNAAAWSACQGEASAADLDQLFDRCGGADGCDTARPPSNIKRLIEGCTTIIESPDEPTLRRVLAAYQRGRARTLQGDLPDAIIDFDFALELRPAFADAIERRGAAYGKLGQQDQAIKDLSEAIRLNPKLARAYSERGVAYFRQHDVARAVADLTNALVLQPDDAHDLNNRCWMRAASGRDLQSALKDCDEAVRLRPDAPATHNSRGFVHLLMHDDQAALADYRAALALGPAVTDVRASSLYGQGLARIGIGDRTRGEKEIAAALALSPTAAHDYAAAGLRP